MGKFKVGDKVSVHIAEGWVNGIVLGESWSGLYLTKVPDGHGWSVNRNEAKYCAEECGIILETGRRCYWNAGEFDIKPLKPTEGYAKRPKRRVVIEITDDGAEAKYIVGKNIEKTASIKRHPEDEPNDEIAAVYSIAKLFGENLRAMEDKVDGKIEMFKDALGWIYGAKEALGEAEKRIMKLI